MKFFNPATLLASPEAAIAPPPENNTTSFIVSSALKEAADVSKKYFDLKALKRETEGLAGYVEQTSPDLASYLRNKAENYSLGSTDPAAERANLIKGVTQLHDMEINKQKADQYGQATTNSSLYAAKLSATQKEALDAQDAYQRFEESEDRNQQAHEANRLKAARNKVFINPYVRKPNPYSGRRDSAVRTYQDTLSSTPNTVQTRSSSRGPTPFNPNPLAPREPDLPSGPEGPGVEDPTPLFGGDSAADLPTESGTVNGEMILGSPPDLSVGDTYNPNPIPETPAPSQAPSSVVPPGMENDPAALEIARIKEKEAAATKEAVSAVQRMQESLVINKDYFVDQKTYSQLTELSDKAMAEIQALPDAGTQLWGQQVTRILSTLRAAYAAAPKDTIAAKEAKDAIKNQEVVAFRNKTSGQVYNYVARKAPDGSMRYFSTDASGVESIVPKSELDQMERVGPVTPTNGASSNSKPSVSESLQGLIKPRGSVTDQLNSAKQNAK